MGRRSDMLGNACIPRALRRQDDQRAVFVRVRSVRLCHPEIAVGINRESGFQRSSFDIGF